MRTVTSGDGRAFEFPESLVGDAWLVGPDGGRYRFSAELLRACLREWAARSVVPDHEDG